MSRTPWKTILFDLDGTLIDTSRDLGEAVNHALSAIGKPALPLSAILSYVGDGLRELITRAVADLQEPSLAAAMAAFKDFYGKHLVDHSVPYRGVPETIKALHSKMAMGVVTNKPQAFSETILKELGLAPFFKIVLGGDALDDRKPHPAPVTTAMAELGGAPETTLIVGDGWQDIQAGKNAGIATCAAAYGFGFQERNLELKPDFVIKEFSELRKIMS